MSLPMYPSLYPISGVIHHWVFAILQLIMSLVIRESAHVETTQHLLLSTGGFTLFHNLETPCESSLMRNGSFGGIAVVCLGCLAAFLSQRCIGNAHCTVIAAFARYLSKWSDKRFRLNRDASVSLTYHIYEWSIVVLEFMAVLVTDIAIIVRGPRCGENRAAERSIDFVWSF